MAVARSARESFPYVLLEDRALPVEQRTTFHLRRLPTRLMLALDNLTSLTTGAGQENDVAVRLGDRQIVALRAGLCGWDNFADAEGKPIPFEMTRGRSLISGVVVDDAAKESAIEWLRPEWAKELAGAITSGNTFTTGDAKN